MNFKNFENKFKKNVEAPELLQASWSQVRFIPDKVTNEQLAIGVLINYEGIVYTKFIEDFARIECAYGVEIATYTKSCIELFEDFLHHNYDESFSSQLLLDKRGFIQGESIDTLLLELLERAVPLSLPHNQYKLRKQFHTVKTTKFHSEVKSYIKNKLGEIYKEIFSDQNSMRLGNTKIGYRNFPIAINIPQNNKIGDLISSVYATQDKIEISCLKTLENLRNVKKYADNKSDFRLFMLSPDEHNMDLLTKADKSRRKDIIGDFRWSLASEGIDLIEETSVDTISDKLIDWSGVDGDKVLEEV